MSENDGVDVVNRYWQRGPVPFPQWLEPLEQTAVHEHSMAALLDQEPASRDRADATEEGEGWCTHVANQSGPRTCGVMGDAAGQSL